MAAIETTRVVLSSALSGLVVSCISTPFDVVKNYWIYSPHFRAVRTTVSTQDVVQYLYRTGGLKSFYTGFGATCCTIVPANLIFFAFYEKLRQREPPASAGWRFNALLRAVCNHICRFRLRSFVFRGQGARVCGRSHGSLRVCPNPAPSQRKTLILIPLRTLVKYAPKSIDIVHRVHLCCFPRLERSRPVS